MSKREVKRLHKLGIFEGIIEATSLFLADEGLNPELFSDEDNARVHAADQWARRMRTLATDGRE
jgi:hypothetical protein